MTNYKDCKVKHSQIKLPSFYKGNILDLDYIENEFKTSRRYYKNHIYDFDGDVYFKVTNTPDIELIPLRFGIVKNFTLMFSEIATMKNAPRVVLDCFDMSNCLNITSFEHCPEEAYSIGLDRTGITSLVGVHKHIKKATNISLSFNEIRDGGIGLLLIHGLTFVRFNTIQNISEDDAPRAQLAIRIINKYLSVGNSKGEFYEKSILECANELCDAGLDEFAKL